MVAFEKMFLKNAGTPYTLDIKWSLYVLTKVLKCQGQPVKFRGTLSLTRYEMFRELF